MAEEGKIKKKTVTEFKLANVKGEAQLAGPSKATDIFLRESLNEPLNDRIFPFASYPKGTCAEPDVSVRDESTDTPCSGISKVDKHITTTRGRIPYSLSRNTKGVSEEALHFIQNVQPRQDVHGSGKLKSTAAFRSIHNLNTSRDSQFQKTSGGRKLAKKDIHYFSNTMDSNLLQIKRLAGADVNLQDANLQTPLHLAVRLHRDVSRGNSSYEGDLMQMNEKVTTLCLLMITPRTQLNFRDKKGNTALHYAVESHATEIAQRLLDAGADVTVKNNKGKTVLHKAAKNKCKDCMAILLSHKEIGHVIDLKAKKLEKHTSVMMHEGFNVSDIQPFYYFRPCSSADAPTALMIAVKYQNTDVADMLLMHKADVNIRNDEGYTALYIAAEGSCTKIIQHLIQAGSDVNDKTNDGETPLILTRDVDVIKTLCKAGADVNVKDKLGRNVLHKAFCSNYLSETNLKYLFKFLVRYNIDINALDDDNASVLSYSILRKQMNNVEFLLKAGANPLIDKKFRHLLTDLQILITNKTDFLYAPELETIFSKGNFEYLRLLVCNGIVLNYKTLNKTLEKKVQLTSLMLSIMYQNVDVAKYLLTTGYVTENDLRQLRQFDKSPHDLNDLLVKERNQHISLTAEIQTLIHEAVSQPWPLVKLAFVTVSTMLGESPDRDERLSQMHLPDTFKQRLLFQTPEALIPVSDWSKCPLFFNPICDVAGHEYSLHLWPIELLFERMKHRLERLKQYTENRLENYSENDDIKLTEDVLKAAFDLSNRKDNVNESNLQESEHLVEACIDAIDDCIFFHGNSFDVDYGPKYLILRSGLQFMLEDFESLKEEYSDESSDLRASVEFFDERLKGWKNSFGNIGFFENITHTAEELRRPEKIPAHHFWWFELDF